MTVTIEPATIFDLAELGGAVTRVQWGLARELFDRGTFFGFHAGEQLIALGGFVPFEAAPECADMYFNPAPGAGRHALGIIRAGRLTIEAAPYLAIVTVCRSQAGAVLAARLGFTFQAITQLGEVWGYGSDYRRRQQSGQGPAAAERRTDRGIAAPEPGAAGGAAG